MAGLIQNVRYALRQLRKSPGFTCTAVLILTLGICASVAVFAFVDAALIKPLPYRDPSRLVAVLESDKPGAQSYVSYLDYLDWKSLNKVFRSMDAFALNGGFTLSTAAGAEPVSGTRVSGGFFRTLGVTPVLGRDFREGEDTPSATRAVILSYAAWQKRFGGKQDVLGQTVTLNGIPNVIVGVLPREFHFAPAGLAEFWGTIHPSDACEQQRGCQNLNVVARLKDGIPIETALADMKSIARQLEKQYPDSDRDETADVTLLSDSIVGNIRSILLVLLSGAGLLFLIACINVSSLLLARSDSRKHEIAIRGALGASPARLMSLFAMEGLLLIVIADTLGLISAQSAIQLLTRLTPPHLMAGMPYLQGLNLNLHDIILTFALSLIGGALFTVLPIVRVRLSKIRDGLTANGRGFAGTTWRRLGSNLVVVELAIAMVLLVGAGLLGKSLSRLLSVDTGLRPDHLATLGVGAPSARYSRDEQVVALARQVMDRVTSLPGVKSAGIAMALPVGSGWGTTSVQVVGWPSGEHSEAFNRPVSSEYFTTIQARLLRGRYFTEAEDASRPRVAIVNQTLARQYFPSEDPIGKRITYYNQPALAMQIVGVVDDIKEGPLDTENKPALYVAFNQNPLRDFSIVVRTSQDEQSLLPVLAATIHKIDPTVSASGQSSMNDIINDSPAAYLHRSSAWLVGGFASLAFLLGVVGLYGVVAYSVSQRTREIGVRMALGAQRSSVYGLILKEAGRLTTAGILLGLVCSLGAGKLIRGLLFGVQAWDAATFSAVAVALGASALLASYIPARRAAKVDPMAALRYE